MPKGSLQIKVQKGDTYEPIKNAKIVITDATGANPTRIVENATTDESGLTTEIGLDAPLLAYSMTPSQNIPYSLYDVRVQAEGYKDFVVKGCQIFPEQLAIQECKLQEAGTRQLTENIIEILPNTLVGNFPSKIPEAPIKVVPPGSTGFVVLSQAVVPQFIVVHAGAPDNPSAPNYTVGYKDYIKNVASCEIFSTWPENTIRANVYCINSFTLNRVFTEWYRNKGKNFTVTNNTAYDQAFNFGRNIYANISRIVDELFTTYVRISNLKQPMLTQYCDGVRVKCPGWLTQWGSKTLGDRGYTPYGMLTYYYGPNVNLAVAPRVAGIPSSYPGYTLRVGSRGAPVRAIQTYLNRISRNYPLIPKVAVDGVFGTSTKNAVSTFQKIFYLYPTGVVNYPTWYKISEIYVAVSKLAA